MFWRVRPDSTTRPWRRSCGCQSRRWAAGGSGFIDKGGDGLLDEPRPGAPRTINDTQVEAVVTRTLETTPRGATHWSTRTLAKATGVSPMSVHRIWQAFGLQPHRTKSFKLSPDPLLIDKVRDIVGLYLNPPQHAAVFCVDEKPQIQALDRTAPLLPLRPGQAEGDYKHYLTREECLHAEL